MIDTLFAAIFEVSLTTGLVILIIKSLSFTINKNYAAKWKKYIWLIIAARLLIPVNFSFLGAPVQLNILNNSNSNYELTASSNGMNSIRVQSKTSDITAEKEDNGETRNKNTGPDTLTSKNRSHSIPWMNFAVYIWAAGVIIFIMYHLIGYAYFRKQVLCWSRVVKEQRTLDIAREISNHLALKKRLRLYVCDKIVSPSLIGFINPMLVIPPHNYTDKDLTFILEHELTHYRLKDLWYKLFILLANAVHWFNPAAYVLRHEAYNDLELACDDEVIKNMSADDRNKYAKTILSCIQQQKMRNVALITSFNNPVKILKDRLRNIVSRKKKRNGLIIIFISLILVTGIGALFTFNGRVQKKQDIQGFTWYGAVSLIPEKTELPDKLIINSDMWNEFLDSDATVALVAAIPQADINVYGLKENGVEEGTYTLRGILVKQGNEIQVLDTGWGVYEELPEIRYQDYDGDNVNEIALIVRSASGTELSVNDLHILKKEPAGGWKDYLFDSSAWQEMIKQRMDYQVKDGILTISIDGKDTGYYIDLTPYEEEWGDKLTSVFFGNYGLFHFDNGEIALQVLPAANVGNWATPQVITDTYIHMKVTFRGQFDLVSEFKENKNTEEVPEAYPNPREETGTGEEEPETGTDKDLQEFLDSPDGNLLKETAENFVKAYFLGEKETARGFLSEEADPDNCVYLDSAGVAGNVYDKLTHLVAKWYTADGNIANVQYEYSLEGEDTFTYLNLDFKKDGSNWVIEGVYLEK